MIRCLAFAAASLFAFAASAAEPAPVVEPAPVAHAVLSAQEGTVLVNQGEVFITAADAQALKVGDQVMVMEGGSAQVTFADGCLVPLESGSLMLIAEQSTCAGGLANVQTIGPSYAQAIGAPEDNRRRRRGGAFWITGTGLVVMALMWNDNDVSRPVSP